MQPRVAQPIIRGLLLVIALPYFQVHAQLPSSRTISNCQIGPGQATTQSTPITRLSFKMAVAPAPTTMTSPAQDKSKDVDPGLAMVFSMALGEGTNKLVVEVTKFNHTRCGRSPTDWCIALAHINPPNHPHFSPGVPWNGHLDTLTFEALATGDDATKPSWHFRLTNSWPPFLATLTFIDVPQGPPMTKYVLLRPHSN
ncbi:hypothetical protein BCR37DRAFT_103772 [Protomyces lactucae-debilis]|uniref:Uncharacterized protein n=1 Tax=Protomyces lactucae-debilis TaxID=2754530 RepID=A0A1Y2F5Y5_PROLT|nr:uncharacterized protein BCR37DRAFT_103772 [Protomyces lactucae-debilis]ORY79077.1 hypothetical protein BCR37DRAFT_103772 [Protomyces lactucae-debilis]